MRTLGLYVGIWFSLMLAVAPGCADADRAGPMAGAGGPEGAGPRQVLFHRELSEAQAEARQEGKPLLVVFSTEECGYCRQMLEKTFHDSHVTEWAEKFVCVQIEASEAPELCKDFHIQAFPTVQFITAEGAPLHRVLGKKEPEALIVQMQAALQEPHSQTAYWGGGTLR